MISIIEEMMIDEILLRENAKEIVKQLILKYAGLSVDNARELLGMISGIADEAINKVSEKADQNLDAAYSLLQQRCVSQDASEIYFAMMVPVCKALFSKGKCQNGSSIAEEQYWELFIKLFKNKKNFSWDRDKEWADMFGYTEYLRLLEENMQSV